MIANILLLTGVFSHSWLECTKYEGNLETYEKDKCLGLPRPLAGNRNVGTVFGQDIGMDFRPQAGGARCQGNAANLQQNYGGNLVSYEAGRTYTIAWPPKNHVAATCTNANIPDTFLRLYMTPYTGTDPDQDTFKQNQVQASFSDDPHVPNTIDFKGFMNCPRFCDDTDKSLCTGTFTLGPNIAPGTYTFQWYWAFNSAADLYATCWEAQVVEGTATTTSAGATAIETTTATTTTFAPTPPGCVECCDSSEIQAPGTGQMIPYGFLTKEERRVIDCPDGFDGDFTLLCLLEEARHVNGYCLPSSDAKSDDGAVDNQSGTVAGLAVALTLVLIAFALYVVITQGWWSPFENEKQSGTMDLEKGSVPQKRRAKSVVTTSNTELPVLPNAPRNWYYTDASNNQQGPVTQAQLMKYVKSLDQQGARNVLVWDGATVQDWTPIQGIPSLNKQLKMSAV